MKLWNILLWVCLFGFSAARAGTEVQKGKICHKNSNRSSIFERVRSFGDYTLPQGDGATPWPRMSGAWVNQERGLVVVIKPETLAGRTLMRVRIRRLDNSSVMAEGARYVVASDYQTNTFGIRLRIIDGSLPYPHLDAYYSLANDVVGRPIQMTTQMVSPVFENHQMIDTFRLRRP